MEQKKNGELENKIKKMEAFCARERERKLCLLNRNNHQENRMLSKSYETLDQLLSIGQQAKVIGDLAIMKRLPRRQQT